MSAANKLLEREKSRQARAEARRENIEDTFGIKVMTPKEYSKQMPEPIKKELEHSRNKNLLIGAPLGVVAGIAGFFNANRLAYLFDLYIASHMNDGYEDYGIYGYHEDYTRYVNQPKLSPLAKGAIAAVAAVTVACIPNFISNWRHSRFWEEYNKYLDNVAQEGRSRQSGTPKTGEYAHHSSDKSHTTMLAAREQREGAENTTHVR